MGKQTNIQLRGTFNSIIYYQSLGMNLMRQKPAHVRLTVATRHQAVVFGQAARLGSAIRSLLPPMPSAGSKSKERHRFDRTVGEWLRTDPLNNSEVQDNLPFIGNYQFNTATSINERMKKRIVVSRNDNNRLLVSIPSMLPVEDIVAPTRTVAVTIRIMAVTCPANGIGGSGDSGTKVFIPYNDTIAPEQTILLPVTPAARNVTVVVATLQYHTSTRNPMATVTDVRWMPAGIVGAMYN